MKTFIIKVLSFSLLLLFIIVIGFVMPTTPRASKSAYFSEIKKDSLLKNISTPRIIFVGGSNVCFGINSKMIKDSLKINPINTAINAGIGLEYMMDNTAKYIRKGDIVVIAPEYEHFYGRFIYGEENLLIAVAVISITDLFDLKKEQLKNIYKYIIKYSFSKFKPSEYLYFRALDSPIYFASAFNKYGDIYAHLKMKQQEFSPYYAIIQPYNPDAIKLINKFNIELEKKGAKLFITFPSFQADSYDKNIPQIKKVEKELINNKFELLGTPERYRMPETMMFNTPYHLLSKGADYRTELLIEDLKKALTNNNIHK